MRYEPTTFGLLARRVGENNLRPCERAAVHCARPTRGLAEPSSVVVGLERFTGGADRFACQGRNTTLMARVSARAIALCTAVR
jgi:hypothetical protein